MTDPTELIIRATFGLALGLFALAAGLRRSLHVPTAPPLPEPESMVLEEEFTDLEPPPPLCESDRVATGLYQPLDLLGIGLIFALFFALAWSSIQAGSGGELKINARDLIGTIGFQFISAGLVAFSMVPRVHPVAWLGLRWPAWRRIFWIAPCASVSMWIFFIGLQQLGLMDWIESLGVETVQDTVKLLQNSEDSTILGLMTFAAVVAAPLCEELIFRGYLYPAAKKFAGPWVAAIFSGLIFAAAHGSLAALLPLFVFGCLLAFIYEKTGSLWAPISVHFFFNGSTVLLQMVARLYHLPLDASP
jgi:membrane protease YdiL (CAAX protease family)